MGGWGDIEGLQEATAGTEAGLQLVEAPRKVGQIAISYARASKQVCSRKASSQLTSWHM